VRRRWSGRPGQRRLGKAAEEFRAEIRAVTHREHVVEFEELFLDLIETRSVGDEEQHAALRAVADRHADDGFEIEGTAREQPRDVRHRARMIAHPQLDRGGATVGGFVT
jgi:hypothetical protein